MSSATASSSTTQAPSSLATSPKFKAFATAFSISGPVVYCLVQYFNTPLFTYWPAVRRFAWGFGPPSADDGPNMLWYGWSITTILIAGAIGIVAMILPECISKKLPLWLVWVLPILAIPYVAYALMPWWKAAARY
jgi:hypothetical protein